MKFYIRIVLLAAFLTSLLSAHAQSPTITWDSTVKDLGDSNYEVVFTGKILPGWHTYDLHRTFLRPWWSSSLQRA